MEPMSSVVPGNMRRRRLERQLMAMQLQQHQLGRPDPWGLMIGVPMGQWMLVWAWRPVRTTDGGWIWLTNYWRRRVCTKSSLPGPTFCWWQCVINPTYNGSFLS